MILQLSLISLLLLLLQLMLVVVPASASPRAAGRFGVERQGSSPGERLERVVGDALRIYVLFAGYALLMFFSGKPDLLPQYLAWAVVGFQVLRGTGLYWGWPRTARVSGFLAAAILVFLWAQWLPFFQAAPP